MNINKKLEKMLLQLLRDGEFGTWEDGVVLRNKYVSQIKKTILKAIMKDEIVNLKWLGWKKGYVEGNFVKVSVIKDLLSPKQ